jgi:acetyl-CoA carboxylase biotin carboxyl carrier protein
MVKEDKPLSYDDVLQIVKLIDSSSRYKRFKLQYGEILLELEKIDAQIPPQASSAQPLTTTGRSADQVAATMKEEVTDSSVRESSNQNKPLSANNIPSDVHIVKAPMVGTFYRCPEPGAPPFVDVGQRVNKEDTVCLIEVMKLFNTIEAGQDGVVIDILVEDGEPVQYGQSLIVIDPNA